MFLCGYAGPLHFLAPVARFYRLPTTNRQVERERLPSPGQAAATVEAAHNRSGPNHRFFPKRKDVPLTHRHSSKRCDHPCRGKSSKPVIYRKVALLMDASTHRTYQGRHLYLALGVCVLSVLLLLGSLGQALFLIGLV